MGGRNFTFGDELLPRLKEATEAAAVMSAELSAMTRVFAALKSATQQREVAQ